MSKAPVLIEEAMRLYPDDHERQVAFLSEAIGKLAARQLGQRPNLIDDDALVMLIELLEALKLPDGPLYIPGEEQNPLFESAEELNRYVQERMPVWTKELQEAPQA